MPLALALIVAACGPRSLLSGVGTAVCVYARNETGAPFTLRGVRVDPGSSALAALHSDHEASRPYFEFDIAREAEPSARVRYRILQFPGHGGIIDVTIALTRTSSGSLAARTPDERWIEVLSVQLLPTP
ncbi:MAG TPA: hypothetical protein VGF40_12440 [Thermoanaerobaculia bacterium]